MSKHTFRVDDVWENVERPEFRWRVRETLPGGKAILQSEGSSWATTRPLTMGEWREGGRWRKVEPPAQPGKPGRP